MGCIGGLMKFALLFIILVVALALWWWGWNAKVAKPPPQAQLPKAVMEGNGRARIVYPERYPQGLDEETQLTWGGQPVEHRLMENGRELVVTARQAVKDSLAGLKDHVLSMTARDGTAQPIALVYNKKRYFIPAAGLLFIGVCLSFFIYKGVSCSNIRREFDAFDRRKPKPGADQEENQKIEGPDAVGADQRAVAFAGMIFGFFLMLAVILVTPEWLEAVRNVVGTSLSLDIALSFLCVTGCGLLYIFFRYYRHIRASATDK